MNEKYDSCHKPDKIPYRVKSEIHKEWIFCRKECWNVISKHNNYSTVGKESQNNKFSCKLIFKKKIK